MQLRSEYQTLNYTHCCLFFFLTFFRRSALPTQALFFTSSVFFVFLFAYQALFSVCHKWCAILSLFLVIKEIMHAQCLLYINLGVLGHNSWIIQWLLLVQISFSLSVFLLFFFWPLHLKKIPEETYSVYILLIIERSACMLFFLPFFFSWHTVPASTLSANQITYRRLPVTTIRWSENRADFSSVLQKR